MRGLGDGDAREQADREQQNRDTVEFFDLFDFCRIDFQKHDYLLCAERGSRSCMRSINSSRVNPAAPARAANSCAICTELAIALGGLSFGLLVADKRSRALMSFEQAAEFELTIGAHHGVGIDGQIDRELAHGGELIAGGEQARCDAAPHLIDELAVDGHAGMQIQGELEPAAPAISFHEYQCTIELVHYVK